MKPICVECGNRVSIYATVADINGDLVCLECAQFLGIVSQGDLGDRIADDC